MDITRRSFIAAASAGVAASLRSAPAAAQTGRMLLKGGCVLSLDPKVGDFDTADVLIEGPDRRGRPEHHRRPRRRSTPRT